jgi:predicted nucleic acid-binding protein
MRGHLDYVLDTSAVLAVVLGEPDRQPVMEILDQASHGQASVGLPFLALMESEYKLLRWFEPSDVVASLLLIEGWPASVIESDAAWRHEAARVKASGGLSLADAWMAALATLSGAQLVHKDREFDKIAGLRSVKL